MPMHQLYDATEPALSRFAELGHKLLLWHPWQDANNPPLKTISYYIALEKALSPARVGQFAQLSILTTPISNLSFY